MSRNCDLEALKSKLTSLAYGAMEPPVAFRDGLRTSLVYLTLSEELRNEHTELSIPNMMIHEGVP